MKHEWEKIEGKPGLSCIYCGTRMFGGNATNVCHRRIEMDLARQLKEEVEREKKGENNVAV